MEISNKPKMIYIEHVEWNYIKERPQYIAEKLSRDFDITVYSPYSYKLGKKNFIIDGSCKVQFVKKLPMEGRFSAVEKLNQLYRKHFFKNKITSNVQVVYVTYPEACKFIPAEYKGLVIYDCMDDMLEFDMSSDKKVIVEKMERALYERADIVFVSSEKLKEKLFERYSEKRACYLIRNGYDGKIVDSTLSTIYQKNETFRACYFGTISSWFDFDVIKKSLEAIPNLEYEFIGPIEKVATPFQHERIHYVQPVSHDELQNVTSNADAYILPFKVNKLIEAVDPVKLYEYINFSKNIISIYYDEIARFEEFVFFYEDADQYIDALKRLMRDNALKYSQEMRLKFLKESTWEKRAEAMNTVIEQALISKNKA